MQKKWSLLRNKPFYWQGAFALCVSPCYRCSQSRRVPTRNHRTTTGEVFEQPGGAGSPLYQAIDKTGNGICFIQQRPANPARNRGNEHDLQRASPRGCVMRCASTGRVGVSTFWHCPIRNGDWGGLPVLISFLRHNQPSSFSPYY